ncbi:MAG: histidine phosphatase family protein [Candidatus Eremiobacteraeota bacterium]|nr:histidine phosphatase family protein [Candidatus Eremiobacteraeota bacterium]
MLELVLVRHGPTESNETGRFQGRTDLPLSALGRAHARALAGALREQDLRRIYSSDLQRARETASAVAGAHAAPLVEDERLREFDFGSWEGLTWEDILAREPSLAGRARSAAGYYSPPGGESFDGVRRRVRAFLDDVIARGESPIAIVTHAGALHAFCAELELETTRFSPGGITRIAIYAGRARLRSLNDVAHLDSAS